MIRLLPLLLAPLLLGAATPAAPGCARAATPVDKAVCASPVLAAADATLNRAYAGVRAAVAPRARPALLAQQRAWLVRRNVECRSGDVACLAGAYRRRNAELAALAATADASDEPIADVTPVLLAGSWKAAGLADPAGGGRTDPGAVAGHLVDAGLPALGTTVTAGPGRLCIAGRPCLPFGWTVRTIAQVDGGPSLMRRFALPATQRVYVGSTGGKRSYVLLIPRGPRDLGAAFTLCDAGDTNCRNALEIWQPAGPDATISPRP